MKKQYAFLLMGPQFDPQIHRAVFETAHGISHLRTVRSFEEAKICVLELVEQGVGAIEVCGAFGPELARELIALTGGQVAVGYVVHDPRQDQLFTQFFS